MNKEPQNQTPTRQPFVLRWLVWGLLILIGGTVLVPLVAAFVFDADGGLNMVLPGFLVSAVIAVIIACRQSALNPTHRRADQRSKWREQFPTQSEPEVQRFLQLVGEYLGVSRTHTCKLSPADRVLDLARSLCGDELVLVEMEMAVEKEYALELPNSFLESAATLGDLFDYVTRHPASQPTSPASGRRDASGTGLSQQNERLP